MTLKQILDQVFGESGFEIPDVYVNNPNPNVLQAYYIANRSARSLRDIRLQRDGYNVGRHSVTMTTAKTYSLPTDFFSYVPDTATLDGTAIKVEVPTSPDTWAYLLALGGQLGGLFYVRFFNDSINVLNPQAGGTLSFEYQRYAPVVDGTSGAYKPQFEKDTDIWDRDEDLLSLDIKWRFKREKGLDWEGDLQIFNKYVNALRARDAGSESIMPPRFFGPSEPYTNLWVQN